MPGSDSGDEPTTRHYLSQADINALPESARVHQFNPNAVRMTRSLGDALGLSRLGLHLVRLESGRDSTQFHFHERDEEFLYILSGRGIAEIGEERIAVGPGDCMAFTAPSAPHSLHNPYAEDLVYLMGGERNAVDVTHYPRIGRIMLKGDGGKRWFPADALRDVD